MTVNVVASDDDGDVLVFDAAGLPDGLSIGSSTGVISGTTTVAGTFAVTVTVTDANTGSDFETFDWLVVGNDDPVLDPIVDPQSSSEGDTVSLSVSATDNNGDVLTYGATGLPDGLTIDASTGEISGVVTQTAATAAPYSVTVTVDDGVGGVDDQTLQWDIAAVNVDPEVSNPGDQSDNEADTVSLTISATDADGDVLTYGATGLPAGLTINPSTGQISGTIATGASTTSPYTTQITITDATTTIAITFTWTISGAAGAVFVGDDFEGSVLSPMWSVVDPVGDGSVGVDGLGSLVLSVPAGVKHDPWVTNSSVRAVQAAADGDFVAELGFGSVPSLKYQMQGLLVEQDADDWLRFDFYSTGSQLKVFAASTVAGSSSTRLSSTIGAAPGSALFMRVSRGGDVWSMEYSYDGVVWQSAGSFTHPLTMSALGPFVGNAGASPAFDAVVDYVANVPLHQVDVSVSGTGTGSVDVSPAGSMFVDGTVVTLTAVADPGSVFVGWSGDVVSTDPSLVVTLSSDLVVDAAFDVAAADVTPPVISGVTVSAVTDTSATVSWTTDEPATSAVSYGPTVAYEDGTLSDTTLTTSHGVTLTGLAAESTYHFAVESTDFAGNTTTGPDTTFVTAAPPVPGAPVIDLWYGGYQPFGERGRAQRWVNVMGNVADPDGVASLSYRVNGGSSQSLSIGPDAVRLDEPGDFNIEIDRTSLPVGLSTVVISAVDGVGTSSSATVTVELFENAVGVPFSVDWSIESNILNAAQVVDGDWVIDGSEVRLADAAALGYDRLLAVGDQTWTDYEVTVPVRFEGHGDQWGTPQSGLPLFGLGLRWQGHTASGSLRPRHGIYPVGAYTWFRWDSTLTSGRYELSGNNNSPLIRANGTVVTGDELVIKARVQTIAGGTRYSVKYWDPADPEPAAWLLEIVEDNGPASGALALFTHHSDVRFGTISVTPL